MTPGKRVSARRTTYQIGTNLGVVLKRHRIMGQLNMRDLGSEVGITAPTWMRLEHGYRPDAETYTKLLVWLMKQPKP